MEHIILVWGTARECAESGTHGILLQKCVYYGPTIENQWSATFSALSILRFWLNSIMAGNWQQKIFLSRNIGLSYIVG